MLGLMTRKFIPFLSLAVLTMGCGKEITEAKTSSGKNTENQDLPSVYILSIKDGDGFRKTIPVPQNALFIVPSSLYVRNGNAVGKKVEITYNQDSSNPDDYEFRCSYYSDLEQDQLKLLNCRDIDNTSFGDVGDNRFSMYFGKSMRIEVTEGWSSTLVIEAFHTVDWL